MISPRSFLHSMMRGSCIVSNDNVVKFPDGTRYEDIKPVAVISAVLDPETRMYDASFHGDRDDLLTLMRLVIRELGNCGA